MTWSGLVGAGRALEASTDSAKRDLAKRGWHDERQQQDPAAPQRPAAGRQEATPRSREDGADLSQGQNPILLQLLNKDEVYYFHHILHKVYIDDNKSLFH